jgi:hypothetical protein
VDVLAFSRHVHSGCRGDGGGAVFGGGRVMANLYCVLKRWYDKPTKVNAGIAIHRLREENAQLKAFLRDLRNSIHACNRNPIPNSKRVEWRDRIDRALS